MRLEVAPIHSPFPFRWRTALAYQPIPVLHVTPDGYAIVPRLRAPVGHSRAPQPRDRQVSWLIALHPPGERRTSEPCDGVLVSPFAPRSPHTKRKLVAEDQAIAEMVGRLRTTRRHGGLVEPDLIGWINPVTGAITEMAFPDECWLQAYVDKHHAVLLDLPPPAARTRR